MASLLMEVHGISKDSDAGHDLKQYQNVRDKMDAGNFPNVCLKVLGMRLSSTEYSRMSINKLNAYLDELADAGKSQPTESHVDVGAPASDRRKRQIQVLRKMNSEGMNAEEWYWVINIILKSIKFNCGEKTILNWSLGDKAFDKLSVNSNLKTLCERYVNGETGDGKVNIEPMSPYRPQLGTTILGKGKLDEYEMVLQEVGGSGLYIEEKYDGERLQLHMTSELESKRLKYDQINVYDKRTMFEKATGLPLIPADEPFASTTSDSDAKEYQVVHRKFRYFSRKGYEYTSPYGENITCGWLSPFINRLLPSTVTELVLDGEVVAYDPERDTNLPYGQLRVFTSQEYKIRDKYGSGPRYMVFDVLYCNGVDLCGQPLKRRKKMLKELFSISGHENDCIRVTVVPPIGATTEHATFSSEPIHCSADDLRLHMRRVIEEGLEGLMVKLANSTYTPAGRPKSWIKLKPEHVGEIKETIDLLILGAYYGKNNRGGKRATFLCGVRRDQQLWSFCKVGGGFTQQDYANVDSLIGDKFQKLDRKSLPTQYIQFGEHVKSDDWPHEWIRPQDSIVIEVLGSEIHETTAFKCGITLRFPRFSKIRDDKDYTSCCTFDQLQDLRHNIRTHLFELGSAGAKDISKSGKRRGRHLSTPIKKRKLVFSGVDDLSTVTIAKSKVFTGMVFHVPSFHRKRVECKQKVKQYGGEITAGMGTENSGTIIVCDEMTRVIRQARDKGRTVVKYKYITDCITAGKKLLMEPVHMTQASKADFQLAVESHVIDKYGDPMGRKLGDEELKELLLKLDLASHADNKTIKESFINEIGSIEEEMIPGLMFAGFGAIYVDEAPNDSDNNYSMSSAVTLQHWIRMGGASITSELKDPSLGLVVVQQKDTSRLRSIRREIAQRPLAVHIVEAEYIRACWENRTRLAEARYSVV